MQKQNKYGEKWTKDELVLALYLYCQIAFKHTKANNIEIIKLASIINRTPSAVARKLGNFGSFDPILSQNGIKGLAHVSKNDKEIWDEFYGNWEQLVVEANQLLLKNGNNIFNELEDNFLDFKINQPQGPSSETRFLEVRRHQSFFRRTVLASFSFTCCVCGLNLPKLLIASHIIPWSENKLTRVDPQNGLCLCALHDKAFDNGYLSVDKKLVIHLSPRIKETKSPNLYNYFLDYEKKLIRLPDRFPPNVSYLDWHFNNRFIFS